MFTGTINDKFLTNQIARSMLVVLLIFIEIIFCNKIEFGWFCRNFVYLSRVKFDRC